MVVELVDVNVLEIQPMDGATIELHFSGSRWINMCRYERRRSEERGKHLSCHHVRAHTILIIHNFIPTTMAAPCPIITIIHHLPQPTQHTKWLNINIVCRLNSNILPPNWLPGPFYCSVWQLISNKFLLYISISFISSVQLNEHSTSTTTTVSKTNFRKNKPPVWNLTGHINLG